MGSCIANTAIALTQTNCAAQSAASKNHVYKILNFNQLLKFKIAVLLIP